VAKTLGELHVPDLRFGRPLRATDGRWVVGGWAGHRFIEGRADPRHDEMVAVSLRLHDATAGLPKPRFINTRTDVFALADRLAWGENDITLDPDTGGRLFNELAAARTRTTLRPQVVHGDLYGNVLFVGAAAPGIIDFTPYWRPVEWAAAVVVVDALAWGGADEGILGRWSHLHEWPQALLHAALFRLAVHALHPRSTDASMHGLENAVKQISQLL
jgi:uncharacterized protein (TIGR02569 family)